MVPLFFPEKRGVVTFFAGLIVILFLVWLMAESKKEINYDSVGAILVIVWAFVWGICRF